VITTYNHKGVTLSTSSVFLWSSRLVTGFVVVSTFLGKFADLTSSIIPEKPDSLADHLERTDCRGNDIGLNLEQRKAVKQLQDLVDKQQKQNTGKSIYGDDNDMFGASVALGVDGRPINSKRLETLIMKRKLILQLLETTEAELGRRMAKYRIYRNWKADNVETSIEWNFVDLYYQESVLEMALQHTTDVKEAYEESKNGMKNP
jgi:hypothetical protein